MLTRELCHIGMKVYFGRTNGEKTLGEIVKLNPTKAKVKTLEDRGNGRGCAPGAVWGVPYSMMTQADGETVRTPAKIPVEYSPFQSSEDQHIMQAILSLYVNLSPENLTMDGEISGSAVRQRSANYHRKLNALFVALGRQVSEDEAYKWQGQEAKQDAGDRRDWDNA